jgi:hypothetical protein
MKDKYTKEDYMLALDYACSMLSRNKDGAVIYAELIKSANESKERHQLISREMSNASKCSEYTYSCGAEWLGTMGFARHGCNRKGSNELFTYRSYVSEDHLCYIEVDALMEKMSYYKASELGEKKVKFPKKYMWLKDDFNKRYGTSKRPMKDYVEKLCA